MNTTIRVALCDDHALVRSGLRRIVDEEQDLRVVGEAGTAEDAVAAAGREQPDVFVIDIGLPGMNGIEATRQVLRASPDTAVLILTVHDDVGYLRRAFGAGARGYLVKDAVDVELVQAIRQVARGTEYVDPRLGAALLEASEARLRLAGPGGELSAREIEVLRLVALGNTNSAIAAALYVSVRTVESHRANLQHKLGVKARADLVRFARDHRLLDAADLSPSDE